MWRVVQHPGSSRNCAIPYVDGVLTGNKVGRAANGQVMSMPPTCREADPPKGFLSKIVWRVNAVPAVTMCSDCRTNVSPQHLPRFVPLTVTWYPPQVDMLNTVAAMAVAFVSIKESGKPDWRRGCCTRLFSTHPCCTVVTLGFYATDSVYTRVPGGSRVYIKLKREIC